MDEICSKISELLCKDGTGAYKIYYEEELLDVLPEDMRNRETLEAAVKNLQSGGFLDVKYARGNAFCIASVKKYVPPQRPESEEKAQTEKENVSVKAVCSAKKACVAMALSAFLGGALSGCIAAVLGAVL